MAQESYAIPKIEVDKITEKHSSCQIIFLFFNIDILNFLRKLASLVHIYKISVSL
jgi:hypothetical protein